MIKYLIMDVDGTLTDGKIYMGPNGEAMKAFSVKDGYVFNFILKPRNIIPVVITARTSSIVEQRCEELGITEIYQGKVNKLAVLKEIVGDNGLGECAYFGDDVIDLNCMKPIKEAGGIVACPRDAVLEVKVISDYICLNKAGEGALREFAEWLVADRMDEEQIECRVNKAIEYLQKIKISEADIGKKVIVNEKFSYNIQRGEINKQREFESHMKHINIQIMVKGKMHMDLVEVSRMSNGDYDEEKDIVSWKAPQRMNKIVLTAGSYIVLYPGMAYRESTKLCSEEVLKIEGKIQC